MRRFTVYDTRTRETRGFAPIAPPRVGLYVCGLTPYAPAHVGHGRTMTFFDVVARALRRWGYRVFYVQNVTNLDDRLITRASEMDVDALALADRHFLEFQRSMDRLGNRSVNYYPFATDYVPEIIAQTRTLIDQGYAYVADDGSVYFSVGKFAEYGKLSGQRVEALKPGARLELDARKRSPEDFVIWKAATPGEPSWESPWGPGRPGWHIEDTAMTIRLLGERYDLHGGGIDLVFPHHEAEIALAESATGAAPLVNYWMHGGLLLMEEEKMSKSIGNVVSLDDAIDRVGAGPLRLYYLNAHYRSPLAFQAGKSLEEAREAHTRLTFVSDRISEILERDGAERPGQGPPRGAGRRSGAPRGTPRHRARRGFQHARGDRPSLQLDATARRRGAPPRGILRERARGAQRAVSLGRGGARPLQPCLRRSGGCLGGRRSRPPRRTGPGPSSGRLCRSRPDPGRASGVRSGARGRRRGTRWRAASKR